MKKLALISSVVLMTIQAFGLGTGVQAVIGSNIANYALRVSRCPDGKIHVADGSGANCAPVSSGASLFVLDRNSSLKIHESIRVINISGKPTVSCLLSVDLSGFVGDRLTRVASFQEINSGGEYCATNEALKAISACLSKISKGDSDSLLIYGNSPTSIECNAD